MVCPSSLLHLLFPKSDLCNVCNTLGLVFLYVSLEWKKKDLYVTRKTTKTTTKKTTKIPNSPPTLLFQLVWEKNLFYCHIGMKRVKIPYCRGNARNCITLCVYTAHGEEWNSAVLRCFLMYWHLKLLILALTFENFFFPKSLLSESPKSKFFLFSCLLQNNYNQLVLF